VHHQGQRGEASPEQLRPLRILLVEDHRVNQELAMGILDLTGHDVTLANNGREAVERFVRERFDVVLMDIQMPEMDGLQATAAIRECERGTGKRTPIVAMTAHAMQEDRDRCLAAGMDDYVAKPIRAEALLEILNRVVTPEQTPGEAAGGRESAVPADPTVFDDREALRQCLGNQRLMEKVVRRFLEGLPEMRNRIRMAVESGDITAVSSTAHALKGSVGSIVARRAYNAAAALEKAAREGQESDPLYRELCAELETLERMLLVFEAELVRT
jgi:protein-histidine pros-kinase